MSNHDSFKDLSDILKDRDIVGKISPKFSENALDLQEIMELGKDPMFVAALLYKLAEEREKTNKLLEKIYDKFDAIMLQLKSKESRLTQSQPRAAEEAALSSLPQKLPQSILPEQDQMILHLVEKSGQIEAKDVKQELGYKGVNAASQRLNKLYREGYLQKVQSGRKVLFLAKT